jgi:hypothetical protein
VSPYFVNIGLDLNRRLPARAGIGGTRDAADMHVGQEHPFRCCCDGAHAERRPEELPVDESLTSSPGATAFDVIEATQRDELVARIQQKDPRIVRADVYVASSDYAAGERAVGAGQNGPGAGSRAPAQRVAIHHGQRSASAVRREGAHRATG